MPYHNVLPFSSTAIRLHCGSPTNIPALALSFFSVSGEAYGLANNTSVCVCVSVCVFLIKHLVTDEIIILVFRDA